MTPRGANERAITDTKLPATAPRWAPDGETVAFQSCRRSTDPMSCELYVTTAGGGDSRRLTRNVLYEGPPSWSPDGTRLVFESCRRGDPWPLTCEIVVMKLDGSGQTNLTHNQTWDASPDWSPDGRRIVFARLQTDARSRLGAFSDAFELFVIDIYGRNEVRLTRNNFEDSAPSWSPDGQKIAFVSNRDKHGRCWWQDCTWNGEIYLMKRDGRELRRLTKDPGDDTSPSWSPHGNLIVFSRIHDPQDDYEISVVSADGRCVRQVTDNEGLWDRHPDWQPASDRRDAPSLEC